MAVNTEAFEQPLSVVRQLAACKGMDSNIFHPLSTEGQAWALQICSGCVVRRACLIHALENDETLGIWGGETERSRKLLVKKLNIVVKHRPMSYASTNHRRKTGPQENS
jgi:WhiB family redox-sensing transcriptional regulator